MVYLKKEWHVSPRIIRDDQIDALLYVYGAISCRAIGLIRDGRSLYLDAGQWSFRGSVHNDDWHEPSEDVD